MKKSFVYGVLFVATVVLGLPSDASAQQADGSDPYLQRALAQQSNVPAEVQQAEDTIERAVRRFRIGVDAGVGLDPELIMFGVHGAFGPIFRRNIEFRPGVELGVGLQPGDVVSDINGTMLDDPSQGLAVFQALGESTQANVTRSPTPERASPSFQRAGW